MEEIDVEAKKNTIAIDFDGVIHRYSLGWQGMDNAYDPPMDGAAEALRSLAETGHRIVVFSSRDTTVIQNWLKKYALEQYVAEVTNTKIPARVYIDDRAYRFVDWKHTMEDLFD
jgi:trehalose-6-phosphatase